MKSLLKFLKPYLRWLIIGASLFFLASTIRTNWQEAIAVRIAGSGWLRLAIAFFLTLTAHFWAGWVWGWILKEFKQPVGIVWSIRVYLITNIAKYLPGNVWHFYGRINACRHAGIPFGVSLLSVLMEPLLMVAAALLVALLSLPQANIGLQLLILFVILSGFQPRILNPILDKLARLKAKGKETEPDERRARRVKRYPFLPLLGELGFIAWRCAGFFVAMSALHPVAVADIPVLASAFCLAWLLGLVIPGAPGGIGVFEMSAIALLKTNYSQGIIISVVALYRLLSTLAEAVGAGLAWLYECNLPPSARPSLSDRDKIDS